MSQGAKRSILRWLHIILGIPIVGYVYSPFEDLPNYAPMVRYVALACHSPLGILHVER